MQSTCRSLTRTKQNVHQGTNPVAAVLFVIITKKRSTSFDHKTKGARLINKKKFSYEDQTRITSLSDLIKWTELQFLSYVSLRNRHLWNTELLIYSLTFACLCSDRLPIPTIRGDQVEESNKQDQTSHWRSLWALKSETSTFVSIGGGLSQAEYT